MLCYIHFFLLILVKFEETNILANAFNMLFIAGFETVCTAMIFCLYELALKKEVQDRGREEMNAMKSKHNGEVNNEFLIDLHYLEMMLAGQYTSTYKLYITVK